MEAFPEEQIARAQQLLERLGDATVGGRIRRLRINQKLSIRDLSDRAGINKNSLVRLEHGLGSRAKTLLRVCETLSIHLESLETAGEEGRPAYALQRADHEVWHDMLDVSRGPIQDRADALPIQLLKSRLPEGRVMSTVIEVTRESGPSSHRGEEFVYVLDGEVELVLGEEILRLAPGDSICFWSEETHRYRPIAGVVAAKILSVRVDY